MFTNIGTVVDFPIFQEKEDKHGHETVHKNNCRKGQCAQYAQRLFRFFENSEFFPEKKKLNKNEQAICSTKAWTRLFFLNGT